MATITSLGVGAGIDSESIVTKLMTLERQPLTQLASKETSVNAKISAYGTLKGLLDKLKTTTSVLGSPSKLAAFNATSSNESVLKATATSSAASGKYSLNVKQLATAHKIEAAITGSSGGSTVVSSAATSISITLSSAAGSSTKKIDVAAGATLENLRSTINSADAGVTASIVNNVSAGVTGSHLVLTAKDTGKTISTNIKDVLTNVGAFNTSGGEQGKHTVVGTTVFSSFTEPLGAGQFSLTVGNTKKTIDLPSGTTLSSLPDTINSAAAGVTASLVGNATDGWRLKLVANNAGEKISYSVLDTSKSNALKFTDLNAQNLTSNYSVTSSNTSTPATFSAGEFTLQQNAPNGTFTSVTIPTGKTLTEIAALISGTGGVTATESGGKLKIESTAPVSYSFSVATGVEGTSSSLTQLNTQISTAAQTVKSTQTFAGTDPVEAGIFSLNISGTVTNISVPVASTVTDLINQINSISPGLASLSGGRLTLTGQSNQTISYEHTSGDSYDLSLLDNKITTDTPSPFDITSTRTIETSNSYSSDQALIDSGTFTLSIAGGTTSAITLQPGSTLSTLISKINALGAGVNATRDSGTGKLKLTGNPGIDFSYNVVDNSIPAASDSYDFTRLSGFSDSGGALQTPQKALLSIDGIDIESDSNDVSTAVTGVTFNLKSTGSASLTVERNQEAAANAVNDFVTAYNALNSQIRSYTAYDSANKKGNTLTGDTVTRSLISQIQSRIYRDTYDKNNLSSDGEESVFDSGSSSYHKLADIGVSVGTTGELTVNSTKLNAAITDNFTAVSNVLNFYGGQLNTLIGKITASDGMISSSTDSLNSMLKAYSERKDTLELRLTAIEKRYRAQFSALDGMMGKMQTTASYLTQQLAKL